MCMFADVDIEFTSFLALYQEKAAVACFKVYF